MFSLNLLVKMEHHEIQVFN